MIWTPMKYGKKLNKTQILTIISLDQEYKQTFFESKLLKY